MAGEIRIVTDSSAQFIDPTVVQRYNITVIPLDISLGTQTFREGVDIDSEQFFKRLSSADSLPTLLPPRVDTIARVYHDLHRETDRIISIHLSRAMHATWQHARTATEGLLGRCEIAVVDSQTTSIGLALLAEAAARMARDSHSVDDIVRAIRKLIPHIYSIFSTESLQYLRRNGLLGESQAILGAMLGIKPFLTIEEGELLTMEKVRTRSQAIDKLVEFVTEFSDVKHLAILQSPSPTSESFVRTLQDRIATEFSDQPFPILTYNPSLLCFLGPEATGIMIYENVVSDDENEEELDQHYGET